MALNSVSRFYKCLEMNMNKLVCIYAEASQLLFEPTMEADSQVRARLDTIILSQMESWSSNDTTCLGIRCAFHVLICVISEDFIKKIRQATTPCPQPVLKYGHTTHFALDHGHCIDTQSHKTHSWVMGTALLRSLARCRLTVHGSC